MKIQVYEPHSFDQILSKRKIELSRSRINFWGILLLLMLACIAILIADIPIFFQVLLGAWVVSCLFVWISKSRYSFRHSIHCLHGDWYIALDENVTTRKEYLCQNGIVLNKVVGCYFWSAFLLILCVERSRDRGHAFYSIPLDSCSKAEFKWLRVSLRTSLD